LWEILQTSIDVSPTMVCLSGNTVFIYFEDSVISLITMCHTTYYYIAYAMNKHIFTYTHVCVLWGLSIDMMIFTRYCTNCLFYTLTLPLNLQYPSQKTFCIFTFQKKKKKKTLFFKGTKQCTYRDKYFRILTFSWEHFVPII